MTTDCQFCRKLSAMTAERPEDLVWEFPQSVAFLGSWQYYHGYCVLIARQHAVEFSQMTDEVRRGYFDEMCLLARAIESCFQPRKLNYEALGNQVPHLHWHLFPRYESDPEKLKPVWVAIERSDRDDRQRERLQTGLFGKSATIDQLRVKLRESIRQ
jgi:diadenosine tetraphosphate (Ap4A) HIT family hydrolase